MDDGQPRNERLAKVISRRGIASRRAAERMIEDGEVQVNGRITYHPGTPVDPERDEIRVSGRPLPGKPRRVYYMLHKPRGTITGRDDPQGRPSVLQLVSHLDQRVEPVGRLDMDSSGVLLFTNDGALANALTHPSSRVTKRYRVKVWKTPNPRQLDRLAKGVVLDGQRTAPCKLRVVETTESGNSWIEITVTEGRNRLIRRMFEHIGHPVSKLRRESFATIALRGLGVRELRMLTGAEVQRLQDIASGRPPASAGNRYAPGHARPKPRANAPLRRKKAARQRTRRSSGGSKPPSGKKRRS